MSSHKSPEFLGRAGYCVALALMSFAPPANSGGLRSLL